MDLAGRLDQGNLHRCHRRHRYRHRCSYHHHLHHSLQPNTHSVMEHQSAHVTMIQEQRSNMLSQCRGYLQRSLLRWYEVGCCCRSPISLWQVLLLPIWTRKNQLPVYCCVLA